MRQRSTSNASTKKTSHLLQLLQIDLRWLRLHLWSWLWRLRCDDDLLWNRQLRLRRLRRQLMNDDVLGGRCRLGLRRLVGRLQGRGYQLLWNGITTQLNLQNTRK